MNRMSISAYAKWVDEGPVLRADLVPVLYQLIWTRTKWPEALLVGKVLAVFCSGHVAIMIPGRDARGQLI